MAGQYLNNKIVYLQYLNNWKDAIIKDESWERFDDLHVDEVAKEFKNPETWIEAGLFLYDCLLALVDQLVYDCILCIPLSDTKKLTYYNDISIYYLKKELNLTPPSLYLFPVGAYNYEQTIKESIFIENLSIELNKKAYFKEDCEDGIYIRTLYIKNS